MDWRFGYRSLLHGVCVALGIALGLTSTGCDYSGTPPSLPLAGATPSPSGGTSKAVPSVSSPVAGALENSEEKTAILDNVMKLVESGATNPGGDNFTGATKNLNQYFSGTPPSAYTITAQTREFLQGQIPPERLAEIESTTWTRADARHLEDCLLYHGIAARVGGVGNDLTRARRVFDWMVQQIQLVPAGSLSSPGLGQAYARPYDVLVRGLATESQGFWAERGWLFLVLCRQLGLDGGLITYTPPHLTDPVVWCCVILIDKKPYLFDARVGMPIPNAKGDGVATLDEALTDASILDRMDLPGQSPYGTTRDALLASSTGIGVLIDSSPHYFAPRMKLLQRSLSGKKITILYRDPAEQRDRFAEALGRRSNTVRLWELPMMVEALLFQNSQFVESTKRALFLFKAELPLLYARMKQLRGETPEAIQDYVAFRFAENGTLMDRKTLIPREIQEALDVHATYFLGMCHLDQKEFRRAEFFFEKTLQMLPAPGRNQPYFNMFRWGAQANLARLTEARGDLARAAAYYSLSDPTSQRHGNLVRARELVWKDPTAATPPPLPPPPLPAAPRTTGLKVPGAAGALGSR
ncbi:MAG: hypothetical protein NVSMB9_22780 [Isosphaeraceae bacterium]